MQSVPLQLLRRHIFALVIACLVADVSWAQNAGAPLSIPPSGPQFGGPPLEPIQLPQTDMQTVPPSYANSVGRPLPHQVVAMPGVQEELRVVRHRSQLLVMRHRVTDFAIADQSVIDIVQHAPSELSVLGLSIGSTTLTLWFEGSRDPLIYLVKTIHDPDREEQRRVDYGKLEKKISLLFPNSKVHLIPLSRKIVVKGQAHDAVEAAKILRIVRDEAIDQLGGLTGPQPDGGGVNFAAGTLPYGRVGANFTADDLYSQYIVNMLEIPGEFQVMLRVRIAELSRSQLRQMGVNFDVMFNGNQQVGTLLGGVPSTLFGIFENGEINVLLNLLASNGTAKILSEPVITTLSGRPASFLSGGEFAVPTIVGVDGVQGQQTTFRGFGTSVNVLPTVLDKDLIRMQITPEFSQINSANSVGGIPGLDTRRANATIELREGQTVAIAGLLAHQSNTEVTRIPVLGSIPFIGPRLFAAKRATQDQTELLILVTPELVRPMDAEEVPPVPGHEVTHPNDWELYHAAMTEGAPETDVYQLAPYGHGTGYGQHVGYHAMPAEAPMQHHPLVHNNAAGYPVHQLPAASASPPAVAPSNSGIPYQPNPAVGPHRSYTPRSPPALPEGQRQRFVPPLPTDRSVKPARFEKPQSASKTRFGGRVTSLRKRLFGRKPPGIPSSTYSGPAFQADRVARETTAARFESRN